jgi:hypothetical protein
MAYVADDMEINGFPKPTFIVQADNTETFGEINSELIEYLNEKLGLNSDSEEDNSKSKLDDAEHTTRLIQLVQEKSENEYCTQEEGLANINLLKEHLQTEKWPPDTTDLFDVVFRELEYSIPNEIGIGRWLIKNNNEKYFVVPKYKTVTYHEQEYIEVPKKPSNRRHSDLLGINSSVLAISRVFGKYEEDKEYKLEKVEKKREVLSGIEYTTVTPFKGIQFFFEPKFNAVENYVLTIVPVFSRRYLEVFNSLEVLRYTGWESISNTKCSDWKVKKVFLKQPDEIINFCSEKISSVTEYLIEDIKTKLSS